MIKKVERESLLTRDSLGSRFIFKGICVGSGSRSRRNRREEKEEKRTPGFFNNDNKKISSGEVKLIKPKEEERGPCSR